MPLTQLIYSSKPFGFDDTILSQILLTARRNNANAHVTGCLICRADLYLQLLEGPAEAINRLYASIEEDDRHLEVTHRMERETDSRLFGQWAMRDDPAQSWLWTKAEVDAGALENADQAAFLAVFERVAQRIG
ncbi:MAG: BLUF domain-containing protein [Paracoccaceae bacterium]|uniref:BLUF domain-containing protein n=1 Tax=Seohaeicola saemankumensis TaxID=481181 RepID=UPI001E2EA9D0|nr:BLUF domain-containing protein [Seohaeicola saemankumensis]MCD1626411.1 BLUF domain-containing protein [Seohaeicola saemankumensis]